MHKNKVVILLIIIVLFLAGIIGWAVIQKLRLFSNEPKEVFSLSAVVQSVDAQSGFLMVKPVKEDKVLKVIVSGTTKLIKLELPFDPKNPPQKATFAPKQTEIKISDFKIGDKILIKSKENILDKIEINNIDYIQISLQ